MAEEEKQIELPVEPIYTEPTTKKGTNTGVIWLSIITGIACLVIIYYVFKKDKFNNNRGGSNKGGGFNNGGGSNSGGGFNNRSKSPMLNSRTISSNSGYGGTFNG